MEEQRSAEQKSGEKGEKLEKREVTEHEKVYGSLPELKVGDIVFIHHRRGLGRKWLRKATDSFWDHIGIVLYEKDPAQGYLEPLFIENKGSGGVRIHRIGWYLKDPERYIVGIGRIKGVDAAMREKIQRFLLLNVDAPYYYINWLGFWVSTWSARFRRWFLKRQRYSCTGLAQKCYYESAPDGGEEHFVFKETTMSPLEFLEITTPGEIARSDKLEWIYNKHIGPDGEVGEES